MLVIHKGMLDFRTFSGALPCLVFPGVTFPASAKFQPPWQSSHLLCFPWTQHQLAGIWLWADTEGARQQEVYGKASCRHEVIPLRLCPLLSGSSGIVLCMQIPWVIAARHRLLLLTVTSLTLSEGLQASRGLYVIQLSG